MLNSALTTAGAQLFFSANWSLLAKFEGEFANGSQTYAGSGTLRIRGERPPMRVYPVRFRNRTDAPGRTLS